jgi:endonuclease G
MNIVPIELIEKSSERFESRVTADTLYNVPLKETAIAEPEISLAGTAQSKAIAERKQMLQNVSSEPVDFALERAIGNNDSVYSNFIDLMVSAKSKIGRVVVKSGNKNIAYATGFMVSERMLMTNWHVFNDRQAATDGEVQFFYELDTNGRPVTPLIFSLDPESFFLSVKELDYCLIAVKPNDITGKTSLSSIGYFYLDPNTGKVADDSEELLNIIHHPDGDFKQLSIRENRLVKKLAFSLWYETDTAQGSSGSPVLNDQFQVVALHHMGVPSKSADGKFYLDKYGKPIQPTDENKVDISRIHWIANEGIRISIILADVIKKLPDSPFIHELAKVPEARPASRLIPEENNAISQNKDQMENINISIPASLLQSKGQVTISIGANGNASEMLAGNHNKQDAAVGMLDELSKITKENQMDFSACKGYIKEFLGTDIGMPQPMGTMRKFIARLKNSQDIELKYYKYSVIFHSERRMPLISAINIEGDLKQRLDRTERKDDWLRDNRIDADLQLNDAFYTGSKFDKGHMSRREDANWGDTAQLAKLYADITCMYTNACPQTPTLNRSNRSGVWGKLEMAVLEKGLQRQEKGFTKISVFNGPIFKDDDPVLRSVRIPMNFYKIIIWPGEDGKLKATAFRLSQVNEVKDYVFEALDIDKNAEYKQLQCSIAGLMDQTGIDFSAIVDYDTFTGDEHHLTDENLELFFVE